MRLFTLAHDGIAWMLFTLENSNVQTPSEDPSAERHAGTTVRTTCEPQSDMLNDMLSHSANHVLNHKVGQRLGQHLKRKLVRNVFLMKMQIFVPMENHQQNCMFYLLISAS